MAQRFPNTFMIVDHDYRKAIQMKSNHIRFVKLAQFMDGQVYVLVIQHKQKNVAAKPWNFWGSYDIMQ